MTLLTIRTLQSRLWLPQVLALLLAVPPVRAQAPAAPDVKPAAPQATVQSLRVVPLAGDGETNDLARRVMAPLVVQILDQNSRPVEGANVTFRFPVSGPSATFANQEHTQTVRTNLDGQAAATGWVANNQMGSFQVHVTASRRNEIGEAFISMTNASRVVAEKKETKRWWSSGWFKVAVIGGAAGLATGLILVNRDGSPPTVIVSPGTPTIGGGPQ